MDKQAARELLADVERKQGMTAGGWILESASKAEFVFISAEDFDQEARVDRWTGVRIDEPFADER